MDLDGLTWLLPPGLKECLRSLAWKTEKGKEKDRALAFGLWSLYAWDLGLWFFYMSVSKVKRPIKSKDKQRPKSQDLRPTEALTTDNELLTSLQCIPLEIFFFRQTFRRMRVRR